MNNNIASRFNDKIVLLLTFIIGYEWLMSGLSKLVSGKFISGFHSQVASSINDAYGVYHPILNHLVMPNSAFFGFFVQYGELIVGVIFVLISVLGFKKMSIAFAKLGMVATILSTFLSLNMFLFSGDPFFVKPSDPFDESVSLDLMLALMQIVLFAYFYKCNKVKTVEEKAGNTTKMAS
jgi:thiosulfate dehydrogenase [quinone] large subunit